MRVIELLSVGIRLVGIYGILKGIQNIAMAYSYWPLYQTHFPDDLSYYFVAATLIFSYFIAVFLFIAFPVKVAQFLMPETPDVASVSTYDMGDLQAAALCVLGVYIVAYSLPLVVQNGAFIWHATVLPNYYNDTSVREYVIYTVSRSLELAIGLYLCLRSRGLVKILHKLRATLVH